MLSLLLLAPVSACWALSADDARLLLPAGLPPSLYLDIEPMAVFDMADGRVRFVPSLRGVGPPPRVEGAAPLALLQQQAGELVCDCSNMLGATEYVVSEVPVRSAISNRYISINDESYKAIKEVVDYPGSSDVLTAVAFSELAYVYNADAIAQVLEKLGFRLTLHRGFMNSVDYPGYRDTQFFVAERLSDGQRFVSIRGTSGGADVETSADAGLIAWGRDGRALAGFADIARFVLETLDEAGVTDGGELIITGHSLGAAVSTLVATRLIDRDSPVRVLGFASPPVGDVALYTYYQELLAPTSFNYYLPNEELIIAEREEAARLVRAIGTRVMLPDVGLTAGAAHYVINYLKSVLVVHGGSRSAYEDSMPHCVVIKYPCFGERQFAPLVPACALQDPTCFATASRQIFPPLSAERLAGAIRREKRRLIDGDADEFEQAVAYLRIAAWNAELDNTIEARRFMEAANVDAFPDGAVGWLSAMLADSP